MCTAISVLSGDHYFGRNLDFEHGFGEKITITPRKYPFIFENGDKKDEHYAIIGMALEYNNYPLYFDATNEAGLSVAGLNFPHFAKYFKKDTKKENIASFEFIPYVLSKSKSVEETKELLSGVNITDTAFDVNLKPSPLHWIVADKHSSIVVEQTDDGLKIFENKTGVLTNSPTFDMQMFNLNNFLSVSKKDPQNLFCDLLDLKSYSRGMGAIGLPGDLSSMSRFVKASFLKLNSDFGNTETEIINSFFHILYSVYQQKGCVCVGNEYEITHYTSCCNTDKGIYYYTTYNNSTINAVDMHRENLDKKELIVYDLIKKQTLLVQN